VPLPRVEAKDQSLQVLLGHVRTQGWSAIALELRTFNLTFTGLSRGRSKIVLSLPEILLLRLTVMSYCIVRWRLERETVELSSQIQRGLGCAGVART
jgi:hypothetical protein